MKLWLIGTVILLASSTVQAENYLIAQSPSYKLDVWIDHLSGDTTRDWCTDDVALRIVAHGDKDVAQLDNFLPRVGAVLEYQCPLLQRLDWTFVDNRNVRLAKGQAVRRQQWVLTDASETSPSEESDTSSSVMDEQQPWQAFELQGGCRLRTFWQDNADMPALFIPEIESGVCEGDGDWLSGHALVTAMRQGEEKQRDMTFVYGFPVMGLNLTMEPDELTITEVNHERMVVSNEDAPQSWMILPYVPHDNSWRMTGTLVIEMPHGEEESDPEDVQRRIEGVRGVWEPWLASGMNLDIVLIEKLLLLRNPEISSGDTIN